MKIPPAKHLFILMFFSALALMIVLSIFRESAVPTKHIRPAGKKPVRTAPPVSKEKSDYLKWKEKTNSEKALILYSREGQLDRLKELVEKGTDVNCHDQYRMTPLHYAAEKDKLEVAEYLIEHGAKVDPVHSCGGTPLEDAARSGHADIVKFLIAHGADVNKWRSEDSRPIHGAATSNFETVKALIFAGAEVNCLDSHDYAPIHYAAANGKLDIVALLLNSGADVNLSSEKRYTALMAATVQNGLGGEKTLAVVRLLLSRGADPAIRNVNGKTAFDYAVMNRYDEVAALLK